MAQSTLIQVVAAQRALVQAPFETGGPSPFQPNGAVVPFRLWLTAADSPHVAAGLNVAGHMGGPWRGRPMTWMPRSCWAP